MKSTNGVPDRHQYIGLRQAHVYRIDNNMIGTHQVHLPNVGMIHGVNKILKTQYPPHGEKPGINMTQATTNAGFVCFFFLTM